MPARPRCNCSTTPAVVIRPIESLLSQLENHRAPSDPAAIPSGLLMLVLVKLLTTPALVIRPIELPTELVNQMAPSGPDAMAVSQIQEKSV